MNEIFIISEEIPYENGYYIGSFSSFEKARIYFDKLEGLRTYTIIYRFIVDEPEIGGVQVWPLPELE